MIHIQFIAVFSFSSLH